MWDLCAILGIDWFDTGPTPVDTTTSAGRMIMQMLGSFAEYAEPAVMRSDAIEVEVVACTLAISALRKKARQTDITFETLTWGTEAMRRWHNEVGDMLAYVNDKLVPHGFDEIVKDDFAGLRPMFSQHRWWS
jgi:hypothetical protein